MFSYSLYKITNIVNTEKNINVRCKKLWYIKNITIYKNYCDKSKSSIFFQTIQYFNIENDISIFSIYRVIATTELRIIFIQ